MSGSPSVPDVPWPEMIATATAARERAHAPYSRFRVGSAIWFGDGSIVAGCNVENRALPLSICAERTAMASAIAAGRGAPRAVVVVTDASPPATPCGMCREFLREFAADLPILVVNLDGEREEYRLRELLPYAFELPPESERE